MRLWRDAEDDTVSGRSYGGRQSSGRERANERGKSLARERARANLGHLHSDSGLKGKRGQYLRGRIVTALEAARTHYAGNDIILPPHQRIRAATTTQG